MTFDLRSRYSKPWSVPLCGPCLQLSGVTNLATKDYATAYREFDVYDRVPPGNPNAAFFKGISLEAMHTGRLWRWAAATGDAEIDFCAIAT